MAIRRRARRTLVPCERAATPAGPVDFYPSVLDCPSLSRQQPKQVFDDFVAVIGSWGVVWAWEGMAAQRKHSTSTRCRWTACQTRVRVPCTFARRLPPRARARACCGPVAVPIQRHFATLIRSACGVHMLIDRRYMGGWTGGWETGGRACSARKLHRNTGDVQARWPCCSGAVLLARGGCAHEGTHGRAH